MGQVIVFEPKQESEQVNCTFDFSAQLGDGETIAGLVGAVTAVAQGDVSGSADVTLSGEIYDDTKAQVIASGGTDGERYLITCKVQGTRQPVLELEAYLPVRNKP